MYKEISKCRISGSSRLITVLSLGEQVLTGVFPKFENEKITKGPVDMVWCPDSGLLQLKQSYSTDEMYGDNYGYRSGLNQSMVDHLTQKIHTLERLVQQGENDIVVDIGSNDATSLKAYQRKCRKAGIDPTGKKFISFYTDDIRLVPDFFSAANFESVYPGEKAKIITSIAMFYDLENPGQFVRDIETVLAPDGIWHFEQSYMPAMLRTNSYDTLCHEHLEFYSLQVVKDLLENNGLRIIDVQTNDINGGSFAVTAAKKDAPYRSNTAVIGWMLSQEKKMGLDTTAPYLAFAENMKKHKEGLCELVHALVADGKKIFGYGASTKGNVLLQYCGFTRKEIPYIAEVNENKFGSFTPGSLIPIISEKEAKEMKPDYFLVLPWHFRSSILAREKEFLKNGGKFIFPLPQIEII
ncbi:MAG: class I SAM-dependent methyltransferase [Chitinophagaceae bacterium]